MHIAPLEHHKLITPEDSRYIRARCIVLQPGTEVGEHSSHEHEEVVIILEGEATVMVEGEERKVSGGNAAYIPPHTPHNILNRSSKPVRYVYVRSR
ncbi:MAG: cupin domain-containing protein [Thermoplasmata archaeon]|nr:cupin domain-containing protein [Thermoplasmata archaeon]